MRSFVHLILCGATIAVAGLCRGQTTAVPQYQAPNGLLVDRNGQVTTTPLSVVQRPKRAVIPTPTDEELDVSRPRDEYPALLSPKNFFGRSHRPQVQYYDPFNNNLTHDGKRSAPGDPPMLEEKAQYMQIQPFSVPVVNIGEEAWMTLILMRDGEIVYPRSQMPGSAKIVEVIRSSVQESPYLYLRAKPGSTDRSGNFLRTTLDVEVVDKDKQVYNYKLELRVIPISNKDYMPIVKVDMKNPVLPPIYGRENSRFGTSLNGRTGLPEGEGSNAASRVTLTKRATENADPLLGSPAYATGRVFTRDETRKYLPVFIAMAKAYDEAVAAGAKGYSAREIVQFQPQTVMLDPDGRMVVTRGKIPAFVNPYDRLTYFVLKSYFFPQYDAILYDVSFKNNTRDEVWWEYSLLGIIPGFAPSDEAETPTVVSPEYGENTPPGQVNELWVLVQGRGWDPSTPVRLAFPDAKMDRKRVELVLPHSASPKGASKDPSMSLLGRDEMSFQP